MPLANEVYEHMQAGFSGLWIQSYEHTSAIAELQVMCEHNSWAFGVWDLANGLEGNDVVQPLAKVATRAKYATDQARIFTLLRDLPELTRDAEVARFLLVIRNFQLSEINKPQVVQALQAAVETGKKGLRVIRDGKSFTRNWHVAVLSPVIEVPPELDRQMVVLEHPLPTREELLAIGKDLAETWVDEEDTLDDFFSPDPADQLKLAESAAGLTEIEAENAFALSLRRKRKIDSAVVWDYKAQSLKKRGLLTIYQGKDNFDQIGGMEHFKSFSTKLLHKKTDNPLLFPRGLLLLGVPGSGKSAAVKCLGNATGRRVLELNLGALRGKFQGETEHNIIDALRVADAMQPCIILVDELEKALSGTESSGQTDGGVGSRLFGTLLSWLNDHQTDAFFVGTVNNISALPPEFSRAERFDGLFFFDFPTGTERTAIWKIYLKLYGIQKQLSDAELQELSNDWTGAEIRSCCRLAAVLDQPLKASAQNVVPISRTYGDQLKALRQWASGRCLSTSYPGLYAMCGEDSPTKAGKRNVSRN